jgi:hypothetical protein
MPASVAMSGGRDFRLTPAAKFRLRVNFVLGVPATLCRQARRALLPSLLAAVLTASSSATIATASSTKKIVFIAGGPSHGFFEHDHLAGSRLLANRINAIRGFEAVVYYENWPPPEAINRASAIIIYADGGEQNIAISHKAELVGLSRNGVGIGFIHYAVEVPEQTAGREWLDMIGGFFKTFYSVNPSWLGQFKAFPHHPVANGIAPFQLYDEWYYHIRFRDQQRDVHPILSTVPPDSTRERADDAHGGNPEVRAAIGKSMSETLLWVSENFRDNAGPAQSRGFGCTGGHFHKNWAQDQFRKLLLNAIVWIAKGQVPRHGIESRRPDTNELLSNRDPDSPDEQIPPDFDRKKLADEIVEMNKPYVP